MQERWAGVFSFSFDLRPLSRALFRLYSEVVVVSDPWLLQSSSSSRKIISHRNLLVYLCESESSIEKWSPRVQLALSGSAAFLHLSDSGIKAAQKLNYSSFLGRAAALQ